MSEADTALAAPTAPAERYPFPDILRGIAIAGILFVNIWMMGSVPGIEWDPRLQGWSALDQAVWWLQVVTIEGTMRGLLELLFGAGFILLADRGITRGRYYRRTLLLILFGLVHGFLLLWPGDILLIYGLAGLFLWPLRHLEPQQMIGAGIGGLIMLTGLGLGATVGIANTRAFAEGAAAAGAPASDERLAAWRAYETALTPDPASHERAKAARHGDLSENWHYKLGVAAEMNTPMSARIWLIEPLAMMLIGAALMRLGVMVGDAPVGIFRRLLLVGYGLGIPIGILEWGDLAWDAFQEASPMLLWSDQIGRTAMTLGHLGLAGWLWHSGIASRMLSAFAPMGRMALTNYISQTLVCQWILFPGFGLGLYARLSLSQLWGVAIVIITAQLVVSALWLHRFRFGPLEWLWRWGSYGRRPRLLK